MQRSCLSLTAYRGYGFRHWWRWISVDVRKRERERENWWVKIRSPCPFLSISTLTAIPHTHTHTHTVLYQYSWHLLPFHLISPDAWADLLLLCPSSSSAVCFGVGLQSHAMLLCRRSHSNGGDKEGCFISLVMRVSGGIGLHTGLPPAKDEEYWLCEHSGTVWRMRPGAALHSSLDSGLQSMRCKSNFENELSTAAETHRAQSCAV